MGSCGIPMSFCVRQVVECGTAPFCGLVLLWIALGIYVVFKTHCALWRVQITQIKTLSSRLDERKGRRYNERVWMAWMWESWTEHVYTFLRSDEFADVIAAGVFVLGVTAVVVGIIPWSISVCDQND